MIIIEYMKDGCEHLDCNSAMIALLLLKQPNTKLHFFCGEKHFLAVKEYLLNHNINISNVIHHKITPLPKNTKDNQYPKLQFMFAKQVFDFATKNKESEIFSLFTTTYFLYSLIYFGYRNPSMQIKATIHQELEKIDMKDYLKNTIQNKFQIFLYVLLFGIQNPLQLPFPKNLKCVVYGNSIKENAVKILPKLKSKLISIPHPYLFNKHNNVNKKSKIINLGFIGMCSRSKNSEYISFILQNLKSRPNKDFQIIFSGIIKDNELYTLAKNTKQVYKYTLSESMLTPEQRSNAINMMQYAIFTNKINSYKYTASGAFIDAVNFEKPIITLPNSFINSYFKQYGNIGYICATIEDLKSKLEDIVNNFDENEYQLQVNNLKKIKEQENISVLQKML